jgi:hypothetical protein
VRGDAIRNKDVASFSANDVPTLIAVRKELARMEGNAMQPGPGLNPDRELARNITPIRERLDQIITNTAPEYGQALGVGSALREAELDPLRNSVTGDVAKSTKIGAQAKAAFPENPTAGTAPEVANLVASVAQRSPEAANTLVRTHIADTFNRSAQNLQGGPNPYGPAQFAADLRGNPAQAQNLEAGLRALPNGDMKATAVNRLLDVFEATGRRPRPGSNTASDTQAMKEAAKTWGALGKPMTALKEKFEKLSMAGHYDAIARVLTDPGSEGLLRHLATAPVGSAQAVHASLRLLSLAQASARTGERPSPK